MILSVELGDSERTSHVNVKHVDTTFYLIT